MTAPVNTVSALLETALKNSKVGRESDEQAVLRVAKRTGVTSRTLRRWLACYPHSDGLLRTWAVLAALEIDFEDFYSAVAEHGRKAGV